MEGKSYKYEFNTAIRDVIFHIRAATKKIGSEFELGKAPHMHYFCEFHYVYDGEQTILSHDTGGEVRMQKGDLCVIPPKVYHAVRAEFPTVKFCFNLTIDCNFNQEKSLGTTYFRFHNFFGEGKKIRLFHDNCIQELMQVYREIAMKESESQHETCTSGMLLASVISRVYDLICFEEHGERKGSDRSETPGERKWIIENFIASNYNAFNGIAELAKQLCVCERQARNIVQEIMGANFKKLIIHQRMEIANLLIEKRENQLEEIAYFVGYRSYNGFYLAYTAFWGISPEAYRKQIMSRPASVWDRQEKIYLTPSNDP